MCRSSSGRFGGGENYGVAEVANNLVMNIEEKPTPAEAKSNLILCGGTFPKGN